MKLSFQPSNELRANTEPRARPESSQVNQRAEPSQAGTQAKLSWSPSLNHAYRARSVLHSRLSQDEPSRHRSNPSQPGRVRTNPSRIQSPELSLEPRPSLASSQAPSPEESLRIKPSSVKHRTDPEPRCRYELRTKLSQVPSLEPGSSRSDP